MKSIGVLGAGSFVLPNVAAAAPEEKKSKKSKKPSKNEEETHTELPVPEEDVIPASELKPFNPYAQQVPADQLPISAESVTGSEFDGTVSTMAASGRCYGTGVKLLDVQVCTNNDGSLSASVGALGLVADTINIKPGQVNRSGYVTVAIPGLPGVIQEFQSSWSVSWSGTTVQRVRVSATLKAWDFGRGWYTVASLSKTLID